MSKNQPENGSGNNSKRNSDSDSKPDTLNLIELKKKDINSLIQIARAYDIENANSMRGQELLFALLQAQTKRKGIIYGAGVLEALPDGFESESEFLFELLPLPFSGWFFDMLGFSGG